MLIVLYLYPVPEGNLGRVTEILQESSTIMVQYGALVDEIFVLQGEGKENQAQSFSLALAAQASEVIVAEMERFTDADGRRETLLNFDGDPRVIELYAELNTLVNMQRVIQGEFDQAR